MAMSQVSYGGKGGKTLGKGKLLPARHRHAKKDPWQTITNADIRRLCRRGGVKRIKSTIYTESKTVMEQFIDKIIIDALTYTTHARRSTVSVIDIIFALKRHGITLYGYSGNVK